MMSITLQRSLQMLMVDLRLGYLAHLEQVSEVLHINEVCILGQSGQCRHQQGKALQGTGRRQLVPCTHTLQASILSTILTKM